MGYDQIMSARVSVVEARLASIEERLAALERGTTTARPKRKKDLTPEQRQQIRERLVRGQQAKREREAAATTEAKAQAKANKKKEAANEG